MRKMEKYSSIHLHLLSTGFLLLSTVVSSATINDSSNASLQEEEIMAIPDDVIIDALFTNIDTVQDQMELCEEGLRQKLVTAANGHLPYVDDFEDMIEKAASASIGDDKNNQTRSNDQQENKGVALKEAEENVNGNSNQVTSNVDVKKDASMQHSTRVKLTHDKHETHQRRRRDLKGQGQTGGVRENDKSVDGAQSETQRHGHLDQSQLRHPHHVTPTEAVVNRLSERLEYLKKSLLSCYSLYQQL